MNTNIGVRRVRQLLVAVAVTALVAVAATVVPASADDSGGTTAHPGRMILVLDSSGSMKEPASGGTTKIAAAKKALDRVVAGLPAEAQVGMRVYGATVFSKGDEGACTDSQLAVRPGTDNRSQLRRAIAAYKPYGETPTGYALEQAAKDLGSEGKRSIVLVSDGEATCRPDPCKVAASLGRQGIDLHIDVVGLGVSGKARSQLQCVAAKGHGTYYGVDSADQIVSSLSRVARRDVRPFTLEGTPIKGSLDAGTPTPITQGVWLDTVPARQAQHNTLHYVYTRTSPRSTLHVSAVTMGEPQSSDTIEVKISTPSGQTCDTGGGLRQLINSGPLAGQAISQTGPSFGSWGPCATAKRLVIDVSRLMGLSHAAAPVQLLVAEEPPVSNLESLPERFDHSDLTLAKRGTHDPEPIQGGTSFPDATEVGPGTYSGETVPGEASVFRVHLDWGQRLAVRIDFPKQSDALAKLTGVQGPFADVQIFDPLRATISDLIQHSTSTDFATSSRPGHLAVGTYPVRFRNRSTAGTYSALAGDYFLQLGVAPDSDGDTYELPYTMHVEVIGAKSGAPAYQGQPDWTVDGALAANANAHATGAAASSTPSPTAEASADEPSSTAPRGSGGESHTGRYVLVGILVAAALACAGGGITLLRRRAG